MDARHSALENRPTNLSSTSLAHQFNHRVDLRLSEQAHRYRSQFLIDPIIDCAWLAGVFANHARYRLFLSQRGKSAQELLDLVQAVRVAPPCIFLQLKNTGSYLTIFTSTRICELSS